MNFGLALGLLKVGNRLARQGWNGKGMFIYLVGPGRYPPTSRPGHLIAETQLDGRVPYAPYLAMKTVDGTVVPWLASQTDILADDWVLAEDENSFIDAIDRGEDTIAHATGMVDINETQTAEPEQDAGQQIVLVYQLGEGFSDLGTPEGMEALLRRLGLI